MRLALKPIDKATMEYWALVAQIVSAIAVVCSLVYVAIQLRENTKLLRSQAHFNALSIGQDVLGMTIADPALAELMQTCRNEPQALAPVQWSRCSQITFVAFNAYEYDYYQNRDQSIPKEFWIGVDQYFKGWIAAPGFKPFWDEYRTAFADPFRSHVDAELARASAALPKPPRTNVLPQEKARQELGRE